jgi:hypothetical protein
MSTDTCTVACKIPNGLELRVFAYEDTRELQRDGSYKDVKVARPIGESVHINGPAHEINKAPRATIVYGYALTHNVSADFMETWLQQNKRSDVVMNKLILVQDKPADATAESREHKSTRSGLEPMDMAMVDRDGIKRARDPRVPKAKGLVLQTNEKED